MTFRNQTFGSIFGLLLLSLLWAAGSLQSDLLPAIRSASDRSLAADSIPWMLLTVVAAVLAGITRVDSPSRTQLRRAVFIALGMFLVPMLLVHASGEATGFTRTVLSFMTPVFAAVFEPYLGPVCGSNATRPVQGALFAAVLAVVGSLLVFPFAVPATVHAFCNLALVTAAVLLIAASNCSASRIAPIELNHLAALAAVTGATTATGLLLLSALIEGPKMLSRTLIVEAHSVHLLWMIAIQLPALFLLFWLFPRMSATQMTVRYLLGPLFAILLGASLLGSVQQIRIRTWLGLVLITCASAWLLLGPDEAASATLDLNSSENDSP